MRHWLNRFKIKLCQTGLGIIAEVSRRKYVHVSDRRVGQRGVARFNFRSHQMKPRRYRIFLEAFSIRGSRIVGMALT